MPEFDDTLLKTAAEYEIDAPVAIYAVRVVLTDAIKNYENQSIEWIQNAWAQDKEHNLIDPLEADVLELHSICRACLTGAVGYSAVTTQSQHKINPLDADSLTQDALWETMQDKDDWNLDLITWNDQLNPRTGRDKVLQLLKDALSTLNEGVKTDAI